jgi:hypothetical protein
MLFLIMVLSTGMGCASTPDQRFDPCRLSAGEVKSEISKDRVRAISVLDDKVTFVAFVGGAIGCSRDIARDDLARSLADKPNVEFVVEYSDVQL